MQALPSLKHSDDGFGIVPAAHHMVDWTRAILLHPEMYRRVKAYDPQLHVYFDKGACRWAICRETRRGTIFIALWQGPDGEYLAFDSRILDALRSWDMRPPTLDAPRSSREVSRRMDDEDDAGRLKLEKQFIDDMAYLSRHNRQFLFRRFREAFGE